jgi:hypothetical protein
VGLDGWYEFVVDKIHVVCQGRIGVDNTFCPASVCEFDKVFENCPARLEMLKKQQEPFIGQEKRNWAYLEMPILR